MTRMRAVRIALHWMMLVLLFWTWLGGGPVILAFTAFNAGAFAALYAIEGLASDPGPRLARALRPVHRWQHRLIYVMMALFSVVCLAGLFGRAEALRHTFAGWFVATATLHGAFHLWRQTVVRDHALRRMTPRPLHRYL